VGTDCLNGFCADGVCCDQACTGTCLACTSALKGGGPNGVCGNVKAGTDPQNECANGVCSAGVCKAGLGDACNSSSDCLNNEACVDGVCCETACDTECYACNLSGQKGLCMPVPAGWNDGMCVEGNTETCDGSGSCKGDVGAVCALANQCASNSCSVTLQCAEPGTCSNGTKDGSESGVDCGGLCKKCSAGGMCNVGTDCMSGTCLATGTCQ